LCDHPTNAYHAEMVRWSHYVRGGVNRLVTNGCNLLFPPRCLCCQTDLDGAASDWVLCTPCLERLAPATWSGCGRCGGQIAESGGAPDRCPLCQGASLRFDAVITLGSYHGGLREIVLRMKRASHGALSAAMGQLLAQRRRDRLVEIRADMVVPIPMFWLRRLGRGMNNPEILAGRLAASLGIPVRKRILVRRRNTLPQADLPPSRRFQNMRGAFRVRRASALQGARVLLVDDVLTTGATCSEAAKVLKQAGAAWVVAAVLARAQGK
jgi:ComF family protein